jgi:hypothetical protein
MKIFNIIFICLFIMMAGLTFLPPFAFAQTNVTKNAQVYTSNAGVVVRVAPGELLPISVKLSNFGGGKRVDVLVEYSIFSSAGEKIYSTNETVAVETTNNFIKTIQIPFGATGGIYTAKTSITYGGQLVPATTQFSFTVERKILGLFQSDFFLYGGITILISILMVLLGHALIKRRRRTMRLAPVDYSDIPHDTRVFYELISDTIMGMRQQVGESALDIAKQIDGLVIDEKTGRVLKLTAKPSKIVAELVLGYEKVLGKNVSFSFRNS